MTLQPRVLAKCQDKKNTDLYYYQSGHRLTKGFKCEMIKRKYSLCKSEFFRSETHTSVVYFDQRLGAA